MASIYKRPNSPFYWVKWRDPEAGKILRESTGFRIGLASERRRALERRDALSVRETKFVSTAKHERFDTWVPDFISIQYTNEETRERVNIAWRHFNHFIAAQKIGHPARFRREHALAYLSWRASGTDSRRGVSLSTAKIELAYVSRIFSEAVVRGYIAANPCLRLGIKHQSPQPKAEITDAEIEKIRTAIEQLPSNLTAQKAFRKLRKADDWNIQEFLRVSFEIALHQGCRLRETYLDVFRDIDLAKKQITFHGKGDHFFTTALNPVLIPMISRIRATGRRTSYTVPNSPHWPKLASFHWKVFLNSISLNHLSFHCTRVTCTSRLERAGCPEAVAMRLLNHASTTVHRIYRRVGHDELHSYWSRSSPDKPSAPENPGSLPANSSHPGASPDPQTAT
jgi:integrase